MLWDRYLPIDGLFKILYQSRAKYSRVWDEWSAGRRDGIFDWQVSLAYATTFLFILLLQYIRKLIPSYLFVVPNWIHITVNYIKIMYLLRLTFDCYFFNINNLNSNDISNNKNLVLQINQNLISPSYFFKILIKHNSFNNRIQTLSIDFFKHCIPRIIFFRN